MRSRISLWLPTAIKKEELTAGTKANISNHIAKSPNSHVKSKQDIKYENKRVTNLLIQCFNQIRSKSFGGEKQYWYKGTTQNITGRCVIGSRGRASLLVFPESSHECCVSAFGASSRGQGLTYAAQCCPVTWASRPLSCKCWLDIDIKSKTQSTNRYNNVIWYHRCLRNKV